MSAARALCPYVAVRDAVCDQLGLLEDEIFLECSLVDDYGAAGDELVEILRAVEGSTGLLLDPAGLDHLAHVLAGLDTRTAGGRLPARRIIASVTVGDLVELVAAAAARRPFDSRPRHAGA